MQVRSTTYHPLDQVRLGCRPGSAGGTHGSSAASQLSANLQKQQGSILTVVNKITTCAHTPAIIKGSSAIATLTVTFPSIAGAANSQNKTLITLIQDASGTWKINALQNSRQGVGKPKGVNPPWHDLGGLFMNAALRGPLGKTPLEAEVFTIGSSPDNQLVIDDMKVSAHHAEIRKEGQSHSITDLGSTHGTYVNSQRLDWNTAYPLTPGSTISIGDTTFTYEEGDAGSASPAAGLVEMLVGAPEAGEGADYSHPYAYEQTMSEPSAPGAMEAYPGYVPPARRSRRRWLWVALIVVVILGLAGGATAVYFFTRATPEKTIDAYCNALRGQDYASAYSLLSASLQKSSTETEFAAKQQAVGHTTICTHDSASVTGNIATDNLTVVADGQSFSGTISLVSQGGDWKISVMLSAPALTLTIFCNALRAGDTHTAYNEYSQGLKNANSEAQFAQIFGGVTCAFNSVTTTGNTGSATIVFVNSAGPSSPYIIILVQDPANNSDWRIAGIQPA